MKPPLNRLTSSAEPEFVQIVERERDDPKTAGLVYCSMILSSIEEDRPFDLIKADSSMFMIKHRIAYEAVHEGKPDKALCPVKRLYADPKALEFTRKVYMSGPENYFKHYANFFRNLSAASEDYQEISIKLRMFKLGLRFSEMCDGSDRYQKRPIGESYSQLIVEAKKRADELRYC